MSTESINALLMMTETRDVATLSTAAQALVRESLPLDPPPLDWPHAVNAAAARLNESWVRPDTTGYMEASGLAVELAATLSAYGMTAAEADHMRGRVDGALAAVVAQAVEDAAAAGRDN
jgi:hypothetical protein